MLSHAELLLTHTTIVFKNSSRLKLMMARFPKVQIADTEGRDVKLPTSSTCVNLLKLPKYDNIETMRNKLLYSIHSGEGFELT